MATDDFAAHRHGTEASGSIVFPGVRALRRDGGRLLGETVVLFCFQYIYLAAVGGGERALGRVLARRRS